MVARRSAVRRPPGRCRDPSRSGSRATPRGCLAGTPARAGLGPRALLRKRARRPRPFSQQRQALEKKANGGDVTAIRELREHHAYWYGTAEREDALKELSAHQLAIVQAVLVDAMEGRESDWISAEDVPDVPLH